VKRLINFPLESGNSVQIEVDSEGPEAVSLGLHPADVIEATGNTFEAAIEAIKPAAIAVASTFRNFADAPEGVEIEFGLKFAGHAGAFIASASTEAQFRVKVIWTGIRRIPGDFEAKIALLTCLSNGISPRHRQQAIEARG
jgi:hypothetical protein